MFLFIESFLVITGYFSHDNGIFSEIFTIFFFSLLRGRSCYYEIFSLDNEILSRYYDIFSRDNEILSRNYEIFFRNYEILFRNYDIFFGNYEKRFKFLRENVLLILFMCDTLRLSYFFCNRGFTKSETTQFFLSQSVRTYKS